MVGADGQTAAWARRRVAARPSRRQSPPARGGVRWSGALDAPDHRVAALLVADGLAPHTGVDPEVVDLEVAALAGGREREPDELPARDVARVDVERV
jgi:hypothetical protein